MAGTRSVYLASPLGFAESTRGYMSYLLVRLREVVMVNNPWDETSFAADVEKARALIDIRERQEAFHRINMGIGSKNEVLIRASDMLVAVLDGVDVDSGTAGEIGLAYGLGKPVYGLRTDFRLTGDNDAAGINLQLRYFIENSGGSYHTTLEPLLEALRSR